jgi:hypothetical protein
LRIPSQEETDAVLVGEASTEEAADAWARRMYRFNSFICVKGGKEVKGGMDGGPPVGRNFGDGIKLIQYIL